MTGRALLRASDGDREQVAERLRQAATEGRLHDDELEERLGAAFSARTYGELDPLVADLPAPALDRRRAHSSAGHPPAAAVAVALTVAVLLVAVAGSALSVRGHGYHHWGGGLGPVIWLVWVAIGLRFFLHRSGGWR